MPTARPHLADLVRVDSADARGSFIRLDRNERISPLPHDVVREILASITPLALTSYPDPKPLVEAFAAAHGLPPECVVAANGSDGAIRRVFQAFVGPGDAVVMTDPTYAMYAIYARIAEARAVKLDYDRDLRVAPERWYAALDAGARLLCLVNPDNPTGAVLPRADALAIVAAAHARDVVCLVDEAYYPCHPETVLEAIHKYPNLIVTRSMSKVYGLGGLRLGFACAQPALLEQLGKVRGLHEVNTMAVLAGICLLRRPELAAALLAELEAGRRVLIDLARRHDFGLPACPTNFQLIELPAHIEPDLIVAALRTRGFLIKAGFKTPALRQCVRVALDGPELMQTFAEAFETVLAGCDHPSAVAVGERDTR